MYVRVPGRERRATIRDASEIGLLSRLGTRLGSTTSDPMPTIRVLVFAYARERNLDAFSRRLFVCLCSDRRSNGLDVADGAKPARNWDRQIIYEFCIDPCKSERRSA